MLQAADTDAVTLGVRFAPTVDGTVTGVRFYKGPDNTGTHTGHPVVGERHAARHGRPSPASRSAGWQTLTFASPVSVTKDTEYVASYRTTVGKYSVTPPGLRQRRPVARPLLVTSDCAAPTPTAPASRGTTVDTNYLVDVVFEQAAPPLAVAVAERRPGEPSTTNRRRAR